MKKSLSILSLIFSSLCISNLQAMRQKQEVFQYDKKIVQQIVNWSIHRIQNEKIFTTDYSNTYKKTSKIEPAGLFVYERLCALYPTEVTIALQYIPNIPNRNCQIMLMQCLPGKYLLYYIINIVEHAFSSNNINYITQWLNASQNYSILSFKITSLISTIIAYQLPYKKQKLIYETIKTNILQKMLPSNYTQDNMQQLLSNLIIKKYHIYFFHNQSLNNLLNKISISGENIILNLRNMEKTHCMENLEYHIWLIQKKYKKQINILDLSNNNLNFLPEIILKLQNIQKINLHGNKLEQLPEFLLYLANLKSIIIDKDLYQKLTNSNSFAFSILKTTFAISTIT